MALNAPADQPTGSPAGTSAPAGAPPRRVLDDLWVAASSSQLTIALAVLLAFTFAVAALLPQLPAGLDLAAASRWLSTTAARYGRFGQFLSSSGLFNVLAGPWIMTLLALSAFHLLLRCVNQVRRLLSPAPAMPAAPQGLPFELVHFPSSVADLAPKLDQIASEGRQGTKSASDPAAPRPRVDAYTERRSWAAAGPLLTYLGPLLIVAGLLSNTLGGWRAAETPLTPGRAAQPIQAGGLALSLVDPGSADGSSPAVISLTHGAQTRNAWLGYLRPAIWGDVWVSQRSSGPAVEVRATSGRKLVLLQPLQGEGASAGPAVESLHLRFAQNESEQAFSVAGGNLAFRVVSYESLAERGINRPVFLVEGYQGANTTPELNELVQDKGTIEWQGVTLSLQREVHVVVDLAAMPGLPLLTLGALLLLLGAGVTAWGGLTRLWVNAAAERDGTAIAVRAAAPAVGQSEVSRVLRLLSDDDGAAGSGSRAVRWPWSGLGLPRIVFALVAAALLAALSIVLLRAGNPLTPQARTWLFVTHLALAVMSLGAFVLAAAESLGFALRGSRPAELIDPAFPAEQQAMRGRAGDPGRLAALLAFPLLTAAVLLGSVWGLFAFAAPVRAATTEMWLLAAWVLGAAYLHATSGWRPMRAPAWLAAVLIVAAVAAGVAALLAASSLLTL